MDIRGIWKVKEVRVPTPDGVKVFTPDNPPQEERFEGSAELMNYRTEFAEDGMLNTLMFVPEEMRQEAAKQGVEVREDGYAAIESTTWKEADGKFYYDTGIQGETLGEPVQVGELTVRASELPGGELFGFTHVGPYDTLAQSWDRLATAAAEQLKARPGY